MNSAILEACLPALVAMGSAFVALLVLLWVSPAKANPRRLLELHRCERGGVQSLAFVLVLPIFITIVVFIVQVSQLLIGMIVVNHAAFAAARSASVWIPAHLDDEFEPANRVDDGQVPREFVDAAENDGNGQFVMVLPVLPASSSPKLSKIRAAAVMGCAAASPSRVLPLESQPTPEASAAAAVARRLYPRLVPSSQSKSTTDRRITSKIAYSDANTFVILEWRDTANTSVRGPTYNPRNHPPDPPDVVVEFDPNEVGWQDAVTVYVIHRYALSSAAGSVLSERLSGWQRLPDRIQRMIPPDWTTRGGRTRLTIDGEERPVSIGDGDQPIVLVAGSATIVNEGLKPVRRHTVTP